MNRTGAKGTMMRRGETTQHAAGERFVDGWDETYKRNLDFLYNELVQLNSYLVYLSKIAAFPLSVAEWCITMAVHSFSTWEGGSQSFGTLLRSPVGFGFDSTTFGGTDSLSRVG